MPTNSDGTDLPSRAEARATTTVEHDLEPDEPATDDAALAVRRQERRVQKKQILDRLRRLLRDPAAPERA